jgi:hypothetical protein
MKKLSKSVRRILVAVLFIVGVTALQFQFSLVSFAAAKTWTGAGGDNKFSTATNWSTGTIPANGDSLLFDATGLSANTTLTNDISGLSLVGITESGTNTQFASYVITGNALTVSGTIASTVTSSGSTVGLVLDSNITLSADTTFNNVLVNAGHTIDTAGHNIIDHTDDVCTYFKSPIVGSGNLTVTGSGTYGGSVGLVANPSFTGLITVSSGTMIGPNGMFGSTGNGTTVSGTGSVSIYSQSNVTGTEPLTLGGTGTFGLQWSSAYGCSGDNAAHAPYTDTWTAPVIMNSNFLYAAQDHNLTISGSYTSNGHTWTQAPGYNGTITVPASTTAPSVPGNLVATPSSAQVALAWDVPSSDGGSVITDYIVQYKLSSAGSWTTFADGTSTARTATVTGLTNGSNYDFRVAAVNAIGTGSNDTITGVPVAAAPTVASAVTFPSASVNPTSHNIVLNWTAPASNGGSAITNYLIEAKLSSGSTWSTVTHTAFSSNSFEILTGLTDGATYDFRISPINAQGTGPSATILNYTYTSGTGNSGNIGNAGGVGAGQTVTAPNTGFSPLKNIQIKSPFAVVIFGLASVAAVLFVAWPRRTN